MSDASQFHFCFYLMVSSSFRCRYADGLGTNAKFSSPAGIAVSTSFMVFIAEAATTLYGIRKMVMVNNSWLVSTFAGSATPGVADGQGTRAKFAGPADVIIHPLTGILYVADQWSVRQITPGGLVTTLAGGGTAAAFQDRFFSIMH